MTRRGTTLHSYDKGNPTRSHDDETRRRLFTWQATARVLSTCRYSCMQMVAPPPLYLASDSAVVEHVPILVHADGCAAASLLGKRRRGLVEQVPMLVHCQEMCLDRRLLLGGRLLEAGEHGLGVLEQQGAEEQPNEHEEDDTTDRRANDNAGNLARGEPGV